MPLIDYWDIEEEIVEILREGLPGSTVTSEEEQMFSPEQVPWLCVYLERRDAPPSQPIAGGSRLRYQVRYSIWCWHYSLDKRESMKLRDQLIGNAEVVLLSNRTLNDKVEQAWLEGGRLLNGLGTEQQDFLSGGEIVLIAEVVSSTD